MAAPTTSSSCGWFILNNHIILESIITFLPELRDITALACVSSSVSFHIKHVFPFAARRLSYRTIPSSTDKTVLGLFDTFLQYGRGSRQRKDLKADGGTIMIGGGAPGAPFTGSWRNLRHVDLSGTDVTTRTVMVLLAATCGCRIPGMRPPFRKEWGFLVADDSAGASLLNDQGLRLRSLSVQNCRKVWIPDLVNFLRKVLTAATRPAKHRMNQANIAANNTANGNNNVNANLLGGNNGNLIANVFGGGGAMNNVLGPPFLMNPAGGGGGGGGGGIVGQNNHNGNGNGNGNNDGRAPLTEALQNLGLSDDDIHAIPGPLPNCATELRQFGLPAFSLRKLKVAGAGGMGLKSVDDSVTFRSLASLATVTGCLGISLDVVFCQGAKCAYGIEVDTEDQDFVGQHHRDTYHRPLPHMPGERIFADKTGRVFRIPKHCIREEDPAPAAQIPPPAAQNTTVPLPLPLLPHANAIAGPAAIPPTTAAAAIQPAQTDNQQNVFILGLMQTLDNNPPPPTPTDPTAPTFPAAPPLQPAPALAATAPPPDSTQQIPLAVPAPVPAADPAADQQDPMQTPALPPLLPPVAPNSLSAPHNPPAFFQPQAPNLREILPPPSDEDRNPRRRIAMKGGPRGLCEGCGRELWLCQSCNNFWVLYCGGCAAKAVDVNGEADAAVAADPDATDVADVDDDLDGSDYEPVL
ncbi:hypothetical protein BZA05DRAFT_164184 [Tricharina praecox]|uniref:uncharacterized protein n=1 Tax=Tricharina praecox TaxID=43433 RepID=UPI00221EC46D|nr:uncharacterized protein BZA05DRAFT_164184 [Tricharina praecox]KAI5857014.1 hypothetical protein BZA05DRAFT_164184 [Tricharina praecox]